jgi:3-hydroxyisobutyrate dehydrogenase-like beta-hydroxyacid dehydrogenase
MKPYLASRDPSGLRFTIANACKDLGYYNAMAGDTGAACGIAAAVLATLESAAAQGGPQALVPELTGLLAARRGAD